MKNTSAVPNPIFREIFKVQNGVVHWIGRPIKDAEASTFEHLGGQWGRDAKHVFVQDRVKRGIDINTFEFLNPVYVKDAAAVYDWEGKIDGADPETFETLDPGIFVDNSIYTYVWARGYAKDANAVFYHDQMTGRATAVRGAEAATFVSFRNDYGLDAKHVWHGKWKLPKADPKSWLLLGRGWSMDKSRMYYYEREVPEVDRAKFTLVNAPTIGNYATDCTHFYDADRLIDNDKFWSNLRENIGSFEKWFEVRLNRIKAGQHQ